MIEGKEKISRGEITSEEFVKRVLLGKEGQYSSTLPRASKKKKNASESNRFQSGYGALSADSTTLLEPRATSQASGGAAASVEVTGGSAVVPLDPAGVPGRPEQVGGGRQEVAAIVEPKERVLEAAAAAPPAPQDSGFLACQNGAKEEVSVPGSVSKEGISTGVWNQEIVVFS